MTNRYNMRPKTLRKVGNSYGLLLDKDYCDYHNLKLGDKIYTDNFKKININKKLKGMLK